jgi:hypothetical protein
MHTRNLSHDHFLKLEQLFKIVAAFVVGVVVTLLMR